MLNAKKLTLAVLVQAALISTAVQAALAACAWLFFIQIQPQAASLRPQASAAA